MREPRRIVDEEPTSTCPHLPTRPGWLCTIGCGEWPCETYREWVAETLRSRYDQAIHMAGWWQYAIIELPRPKEAGSIHRRFLGWTRETIEAGPVRGTPPGGL